MSSRVLGAEGGLSTRAMARILGCNQSTVVRDLARADRPAGRVRGIDGKLYPGRRLAAADREYVFGRAHWLRHEEALSVRQIKARLAAEGVSVSVGTVAADLSRPCVTCPDDANGSPEHPVRTTGVVA